MLFETRRCKHCQSSYNYQASGEGCFREENDGDYCPDCMMLINEALKSVPRKYCPKYDEYEPSTELLNKFKELRSKCLKFPAFSCYCSEMSDLDYDHIIIYTVGNIEYAECFNDGEEKHYFILKEYDLINKRFSDKNWYKTQLDGFRYGANILRSLKKARFLYNE